MKKFKEGNPQQVKGQRIFQRNKIFNQTLRITPQLQRLRLKNRRKPHNWKLVEAYEQFIDQVSNMLIMETSSRKTRRKLHIKGVAIYSRVPDSDFLNLGKNLKDLSTVQEMTLSFANCYTVSDKRVYLLCKGLKKLRFLKQLAINLGDCKKITDAGFYILGDALKTLISLQSVHIYFGGLLQRLPVQFSNINKMKFLSAEKNEGPSAIIKSLKRHRCLQGLWLSFSNDDHNNDKELESFSRSLKKLASLQEIYLDFSQCRKINDNGLLNISEALEELTSLKRITLNFYYVIKAARNKARERFSALPSLENLILEMLCSG